MPVLISWRTVEVPPQAIHGDTSPLVSTPGSTYPLSFEKPCMVAHPSPFEKPFVVAHPPPLRSQACLHCQHWWQRQESWELKARLGCMRAVWKAAPLSPWPPCLLLSPLSEAAVSDVWCPGCPMCLPSSVNMNLISIIFYFCSEWFHLHIHVLIHLTNIC